jgi:hypothetical protein
MFNLFVIIGMLVELESCSGASRAKIFFVATNKT